MSFSIVYYVEKGTTSKDGVQIWLKDGTSASGMILMGTKNSAVQIRELHAG